MNTKNKKIIMLLVALTLVGGAAFYGGMQYQQSQTPTRGFAGRTGSTGAGQGRGGFSGTMGSVLSKDATSFTVSIPSGGSKIVLYSASTTVMKSSSATLNDVTVGSNVVVTGTTNADGSVTAQSVRLGDLPQMRQPQQAAQ